MGFKDFAGAGVVHLIGGITAFIGSYFMGARPGLFRDDKQLSYMTEEENFFDFQIEDKFYK